MLNRKLIVPIFLGLLLTCFIVGSLHSQCSFDPTVDVSPVDADNIYCPGDQITLSTQTYDSYQWFYG